MDFKIIEIGGIVAVSMGLIELVKFVINKYTAKSQFNGSSQAILNALEVQNNNHLSHIQAGINDGFDKIVECQNKSCLEITRSINDGNRQIIQLLGEINGRLK